MEKRKKLKKLFVFLANHTSKMTNLSFLLVIIIGIILGFTEIMSFEYIILFPAVGFLLGICIGILSQHIQYKIYKYFDKNNFEM